MQTNKILSIITNITIIGNFEKKLIFCERLRGIMDTYNINYHCHQ